ncbi:MULTISPECIES: hypothetical protein [Sulfitobacter]|uniref:Uncharacterized protein n=1 Tax=Sulfitobacter profundi TaxID=2679961 RepID=A0ABW1YYF3_9RHOB|nr:hypothetical protein [Sulfitobacter indolifex]
MNKMLGMDRYDRNARLNPALLTVLPALLFVFVWFPAVWTQLGAIAALVVTCGILFALSRLARKSGRNVERKLGKKIGRLHTASLLSLADDRLPKTMKTKCRTYIETHSKIGLPSLADESNDAKVAEEDRLLAVRWLLEHTRPQSEASLLLNENISYGFTRNLLGLKPLGILVTSAVTLGSAYFLYDLEVGTTEFVLGALLCGSALVGLLMWVFLVTKTSVIQASQVYAEKILSLCLEN